MTPLTVPQFPFLLLTSCVSLFQAPHYVFSSLCSFQFYTFYCQDVFSSSSFLSTGSFQTISCVSSSLPSVLIYGSLYFCIKAIASLSCETFIVRYLVTIFLSSMTIFQVRVLHLLFFFFFCLFFFSLSPFFFSYENVHASCTGCLGPRT